MIVVDSSVWIDFVRARSTEQTEKLKDLFGVRRILIGDLILEEVMQGCDDIKVFDETLKLFDRFDFVVLSSYKVCIAAARNYVHLRSLGYTVRKTIDTIIATRCILSGFEILHNDRDFSPFEKHLGLKSLIPASDR